MKKERLFLLAVLGSSLSCVAEDAPDGIFAPDLDASVTMDAPSLDAVSEPPDFGCGSDDTIAPLKLECTGLYSDWAAKKIAPGVREFTPSTPFWSDGAEKHRWVYLPPGTTIDASSRSDWVFPIGTMFWKEFRIAGKRIETRLFKKLRADRWVSAAYAWSKDDMSTASSMGGDQSNIDVGGGAPYHIATPKECSDCHKGRQDRILGFEEISLGGANAVGLTLATLVAEGRLSPPPPSVDVRIPDDGTGAAAPALSWLHINCGVACHNRTSAATGSGTKLFLRFDPADIGSKPISEWDIMQTTLRATTITPAWLGETRVVPGFPDRSLLVRLISSRGTEQMPPIGTHLVDQKNVDLVKEWVAKMAIDPVDAGQPDASDGAPADASDPSDANSTDVSIDTGNADAGAPDVGTPDAGPPDVSVPDAGVPDAGVPDAGAPDVESPDGADAAADAGSSDTTPPSDSDDDHADGGNDDAAPDAPVEDAAPDTTGSDVTGD